VVLVVSWVVLGAVDVVAEEEHVADQVVVEVDVRFALGPVR